MIKCHLIEQRGREGKRARNQSTSIVQEPWRQGEVEEEEEERKRQKWRQRGEQTNEKVENR